MADKLAAYMNTVDTDINIGILDTGNLLDTLGGGKKNECRKHFH